MPKEYSRIDRISELLQRELAKLLQQEIQDPRLSLVTITHIKISRDLAHAKVFITQHKSEQVIMAETVKILNKAAGHLRFCLAKAMQMRVIPQLKFHYDAELTQSIHLSALIDTAIVEDEQHPHDKKADH
jgi:ribosome-binding factor A